MQKSASAIHQNNDSRTKQAHSKHKRRSQSPWRVIITAQALNNRLCGPGIDIKCKNIARNIIEYRRFPFLQETPERVDTGKHQNSNTKIAKAIPRRQFPQTKRGRQRYTCQQQISTRRTNVFPPGKKRKQAISKQEVHRKITDIRYPKPTDFRLHKMQEYRDRKRQESILGKSPPARSDFQATQCAEYRVQEE